MYTVNAEPKFSHVIPQLKEIHYTHVTFMIFLAVTFIIR